MNEQERAERLADLEVRVAQWTLLPAGYDPHDANKVIRWLVAELRALIDKSLTTTEQRVLDALNDLGETSSGRRVAEAAGVSPTTASEALHRLKERGSVTCSPYGRALLWSMANPMDTKAAPRQGNQP